MLQVNGTDYCVQPTPTQTVSQFNAGLLEKKVDKHTLPVSRVSVFHHLVDRDLVKLDVKDALLPFFKLKSEAERKVSFIIVHHAQTTYFPQLQSMILLAVKHAELL